MAGRAPVVQPRQRVPWQIGLGHVLDGPVEAGLLAAGRVYEVLLRPGVEAKVWFVEVARLVVRLLVQRLVVGAVLHPLVVPALPGPTPQPTRALHLRVTIEFTVD